MSANIIDCKDKGRQITECDKEGSSQIPTLKYSVPSAKFLVRFPMTLSRLLQKEIIFHCQKYVMPANGIKSNVALAKI